MHGWGVGTMAGVGVLAAWFVACAGETIPPIDDDLRQERLQRMDPLELPVQHHLPEREEDRAHRERHVTQKDRGPGLARREELVREQHEDPGKAE